MNGSIVPYGERYKEPFLLKPDRLPVATASRHDPTPHSPAHANSSF